MKALPEAAEEYPVGQDQLDELRELESSLAGINASIEEKVRSLSDLIFEEISRTKDSGFNQLRLNFELSSYEARLRFLEELKRNNGRRPAEDAARNKISEYFS